MRHVDHDPARSANVATRLYGRSLFRTGISLVQRKFGRPGVRPYSELEIPALSENLLSSSHASPLVLQVVSPLHSIPSSSGLPSVKMADVKKGKTPKEFFGVYHAFVASMLPACGFDMEN